MIALRQLEKITGFTARLDPFERLERINPIVWREFGEAQTMLFKKGLAVYSGKVLRIAVLIYFATLVVEFGLTTWGLMYPGTPRLPSLVPLPRQAS
ncbi:MAG: hypothetical protein KF716_12560 [Anaerolineae bacterium]|nr:hypothetical protein [Anaerolineae bacterium]